MSQHHFLTVHAQRPIRVVMGYDRALNYVFMTVERLDDAERIYLYNNRFDEEAATHCQDVYHYRDVLVDLRLTVPASMFSEVEHDRINRVGNRIVDHFADGGWREHKQAI
jgi:hypothetical protein